MFRTEIPSWVVWLAQDKNGYWWGYSIEPQQHSTGWYENEVGDYIQLSSSKINLDWQNSLHKKPI